MSDVPPRQAEIAVIIPALNAASTIGACLRALAQSDRPVGAIIVVDDGSTDGTCEIARAAGARVLVNAATVGAAQSRNVGAKATSAELLVFVDADVAVAPDAIGRLEQAFIAEPELAAAFGSYDDDPNERNIASLYGNLRHHFVHAREAEGAEAATFWTGLGAMRRSVFMELGGFEAGRLAIEDIELGIRANAAGRLIRIFPSVQSKHLKRWTAISLMKTDIFVRAMPWAELILSGKGQDTTLNLRSGERLSAVLAWMAVLFSIATFFVPSFLIVVVYTVVTWLLLQFRFGRLLVGVIGWKAAPVLWLHFLYYLYASTSFAWTAARHRMLRRHWPAHEPSPSDRPYAL